LGLTLHIAKQAVLSATCLTPASFSQQTKQKLSGSLQS